MLILVGKQETVQKRRVSSESRISGVYVSTTSLFLTQVADVHYLILYCVYKHIGMLPFLTKFMEMKSPTEKENTNINDKHTQSSCCQHFCFVFQNSNPPDVISEASHPETILVGFLVRPVDVWMAGQMYIRPRLLPYDVFQLSFH